MNTTLYAYQSPLLAQKKILDNISRCESRRDTISHNIPMPDMNTTISEVPKLQAVATKQIAEPQNGAMTFKEVRSMIGRCAKRAYIAELMSERGIEIISKAKKYNIPFERENIDFLALIDEVEEYERLLDEAEEQGVDWDIEHYDPEGLEDAIASRYHDEYLNRRAIESDYYASR